MSKVRTLCAIFFVLIISAGCTTISGTTPDGVEFRYSRIFQDYETSADISKTSDTMRIVFDTKTNSDPAIEAVKAGVAIGAGLATAAP